MDPKITGKLISEKRKEKGLNQIELGQLLNVSNRTISKWEKGDGYPDITILPDIAKCLDVTIDELLTGEKPTAANTEKENNINDNKSGRQRYLNDFKLSFIISLAFGSLAFLLGGVTELYNIWAFPTLFYNHWEIMFCAISLFSVIASVFAFVMGVFRLHLGYNRHEIISQTKLKALILFIILAFFPLTFVARVIAVSGIRRFMIPIMVLVVILLIGATVLVYRKVKTYEKKCNQTDTDNIG